MLSFSLSLSLLVKSSSHFSVIRLEKVLFSFQQKQRFRLNKPLGDQTSRTSPKINWKYRILYSSNSVPSISTQTVSPTPPSPHEIQHRFFCFSPRSTKKWAIPSIYPAEPHPTARCITTSTSSTSNLPLDLVVSRGRRWSSARLRAQPRPRSTRRFPLFQ